MELDYGEEGDDDAKGTKERKVDMEHLIGTEKMGWQQDNAFHLDEEPLTSTPFLDRLRTRPLSIDRYMLGRTPPECRLRALELVLEIILVSRKSWIHHIHTRSTPS
ncbi:hypothetical protein BDP27DRAFT_1422348 [Rhodocollybia butyracea]|uniref:Uncharacterized protein n=1 Tax=Rhodocollybia butyracea TaxID=206335 RepID=A0A9P5PLA9_9AGAR|nr:hypothetical protein BDP27DRAFT_1422348 [Rhodocollybia butyracea]